MVEHIVLFWLKDKADVERSAALLNGMRGKIPGLVSINAAPDFVHSPRSCDLCLTTRFETREALEAYRTHPVHLPVQAHMHAVMERSVSADIEVDA